VQPLTGAIVHFLVLRSRSVVTQPQIKSCQKGPCSGTTASPVRALAAILSDQRSQRFFAKRKPSSSSLFSLAMSLWFGALVQHVRPIKRLVSIFRSPSASTRNLRSTAQHRRGPGTRHTFGGVRAFAGKPDQGHSRYRMLPVQHLHPPSISLNRRLSLRRSRRGNETPRSLPIENLIRIRSFSTARVSGQSP